MLSCSICNRVFTSRKLKKCALVCTTRVQIMSLLSLCNFFQSCAAILLVSTSTHIYIIIYMFESFKRALRWRGNAMIKKKMRTMDKVLRCNYILFNYCRFIVVRWIRHCIVQVYTGPALLFFFGC